jgi:hypothetical protein
VSPRPLTATLYYLKRTADRPVRYVKDPPRGVPAWNGVDDPREIRIEDGRGRESEFNLDANGFALVRSPTKVRNFYSREEVQAVAPRLLHPGRRCNGSRRRRVRSDRTAR